MRKLTALCLALCIVLSGLNLSVFAVTEEPAAQGQISAAEPEAAETETPVATEETAETDPALVPAEETAEVAETETVAPAEAAEASPEEAPIPTGFDAFPDVSGHWAEETLRWAYDNGLLQGFEDGTLRPDDNMLCAEAFTILTRLLHAEKQGDPFFLHLTGSEWYANAATKAEYLDLTRLLAVDEVDAPIYRLNAFRMLNTAFQLRDNMQWVPLTGYTDLGYCSGWERQEMRYLLEKGYIEGHDGKLEPYSNLTRAEFITMLHRIVPNLGADAETLPASGGALLTGAVDLTGKTITEPLWLDCATSALTLKDTTAENITVLSQQLNTVEVSGKSHIKQLTIAGGNGETLTFSTKGEAIVDTLIVGDHRGDVTVTGKVKTLIIGNSDPVIINAEDVSLLQLISLNNITVNTYIPNVEVYDSSHVTGSGSIGTITYYNGELNDSEAPFFNGNEVIVDKRDYGIESIAFEDSAPETLPVGAPLTYSVKVTNPLEKSVTVRWHLEEKIVHTEQATIGPNGTTLSYTYPITYAKDMNLDCNLSMHLVYEEEFGIRNYASTSTTVTLKNYPDAHYDKAALSSVTTGYQGDYTLEWAESNDYDDSVKTAWVNAKGYGSKTGYLIWVNLAYQRVNIFEGSKGNWTLIRTCLMGSGRNGHNTPVGSYTVTGHDADGWTTATYNVHPVTNFTNATYKEMGFHSRKFDPAQTKIIDARIGFPISDGCIRMYDEDAWWIFDNIPHGTAVVVY